MEKKVKYITARLKEASTWRGLIMLVAGVSGLEVSNELAATIVSVGVAASGVLGTFLPDSKSN